MDTEDAIHSKGRSVSEHRRHDSAPRCELANWRTGELAGEPCVCQSQHRRIHTTGHPQQAVPTLLLSVSRRPQVLLLIGRPRHIATCSHWQRQALGSSAQSHMRASEASSVQHCIHPLQGPPQSTAVQATRHTRRPRSPPGHGSRRSQRRRSVVFHSSPSITRGDCVTIACHAVEAGPRQPWRLVCSQTLLFRDSSGSQHQPYASRIL
jgi:hypothetical protein